MAAEELFTKLPSLTSGSFVLQEITPEDGARLIDAIPGFPLPRALLHEAHLPASLPAGFGELSDPYGSHQLSPWRIEGRRSGRVLGVCGFLRWDLLHARAGITAAILPAEEEAPLSHVLGAMMAFGFHEMELNRIEMLVCDERSRRAIERAGMACEAILRQYLRIGDAHEDLSLYAALAEQWHGLRRNDDLPA